MSASHSHANSPAEAGRHIASDAGDRVKATPSRAADFVTLTKPRLNFLVLLTTAAAYSLGAGPDSTLMAFAHTLLGTFLVAGGASALNQVWERETDKLMRRTRMRPMADMRMQPVTATTFGLVLTVIGAVELSYFLNPLSATVAVFTAVSYVLFYTPLKTRTSLSTIVGALPGALPAVIGWAAATNTLSIEGWVLFGIVFMWQMPHFLAIAWIYRDDYRRAGFPMLPVVEPDGARTGRQALLYALALVPVSLLPALVGVSGLAYFWCALVLGVTFLVLAARFAALRSEGRARTLFYGSLLYLPLIWAVMILDH